LQAGIVRLRPILMTAFSTIAGILPIAIGFGAGAESRRPMGVAVVGGMLTSTFLTLIIIPVVYTIFSDIADKFGWKQHLETTDGVASGPEAPTSLHHS
jgi:HAE1 family hydrophobic/amphiphilic exporter-1